ncbi:MAG TPA: TlpA disulfide reductase family protein [Pyrinomonadaceae bacterium]|nr:TlpA disulfide reductase family protein [Pyrinomonadaceae bacterium]
MASKSKSTPHANTSFFTPARLALTALVLCVATLIGASSCNSNDSIGGAKEPAKATSPNMLPPSVRDAEMRAVTGAPIKLSDYSGKVVILNLWATWCGPCRMEIPELVRVYKEYRDQGLEVVGLSTENPDASAEGVRRFIQQYEMDYRVGWSPPAVSIALMQGRDAIPQSFVISRDGRILKRFIGYNYQSTPPQLRQAIEEALKG